MLRGPTLVVFCCLLALQSSYARSAAQTRQHKKLDTTVVEGAVDSGVVTGAVDSSMVGNAVASEDSALTEILTDLTKPTPVRSTDRVTTCVNVTDSITSDPVLVCTSAPPDLQYNASDINHLPAEVSVVTEIHQDHTDPEAVALAKQTMLMNATATQKILDDLNSNSPLYDEIFKKLLKDSHSEYVSNIQNQTDQLCNEANTYLDNFVSDKKIELANAINREKARKEAELKAIAEAREALYIEANATLKSIETAVSTKLGNFHSYQLTLKNKNFIAVAMDETFSTLGETLVHTVQTHLESNLVTRMTSLTEGVVKKGQGILSDATQDYRDALKDNEGVLVKNLQGLVGEVDQINSWLLLQREQTASH